MNESIVLTFKEALELLQISQPTLTRLINLGVIPYVKIGTTYRFSKEALIQWTKTKASHPSRPKGG